MGAGFNPIQSRFYEVPHVSWIGQADGSQLVGGSSPLLPGMTVIAIGSAYHSSSGANITVNIPSGWTNRVFFVGSDGGSQRVAQAIWTKKITGPETPDFFTGDNANQMHFYGFWDDTGGDPFSVYTIPTIGQWGQLADTNMSPEAGNLSAIGGKPFLIVNTFRSSGAITTDSVNYNSAEQTQVRNANSQANNNMVTRINYVSDIANIPTGIVTVDMGDHGSLNMSLGVPLIIG